MHRYFFTTKDAFINSGSDQITGDDWKNKNTGQDEILELKKVFWNRDFHYSTRALIQFDADEIENYISASVLPSTYKLNHLGELANSDNEGKIKFYWNSNSEEKIQSYMCLKKYGFYEWEPIDLVSSANWMKNRISANHCLINIVTDFLPK